MPRVCIVESPSHPAPGMLGRRLGDFSDFSVRTTASVTENLDIDEALVLNNICPEPGRIPEESILQFVAAGGGLFGVHDSVFPYRPDQRLLAACGIRKAYGAIQTVLTENGREHRVLLATANEQDPMERFPIRTLMPGHPILTGVADFDLAEEVWAQNLAAGVQPLLSVQVGDVVSAHQRFLEPIPIAACRAFDRGRISFFSLGHFGATYSDPNFLRFTANAINWIMRNLDERRFSYDVFLSFSKEDRDEAVRIRDRGKELRLNVFMSARNLQAGDIWDEVVRAALVGSREVAILITPNSLRSEWVATEWGAAWAMEKRITPILLRCDYDQLPERLARRDAVDFHNYERFLTEVRVRAGA